MNGNIVWISIWILGICTHFVCSMQPWPLKVDRYGSCCSKIAFNKSVDSITVDSDKLSLCLASFENPETKDKGKISILSLAMTGKGDFEIQNIDLFAPFHQGIIGAYCEHHSYLCKTITNWSNSDIEITDFRWNKVKLLIDALDSSNGWAKDSEAIVWIDADAIVLDFGLRIEDYLRQYPEADMIVSADIKQGLINTGFIIFRNNKWTKLFLSRWWNIADRRVICDQDAFDRLYLTLLQERQSNGHNQTGMVPNIKILSTDSLNSHPPAWMYQGPTNQILHLMGEVALYRAMVFRKAYQSICQARSGGILLPQLGVHQEMLLEYARQVYKQETQRLFNQANITGSFETIEQLTKVSHRYVDVLTFDLQRMSGETPLGSQRTASINYHEPKQHQELSSEIFNIRKTVFQLALYQIDQVKQKLTKLTNDWIEHAKQKHQSQLRHEETANNNNEEFTITYEDLLKDNKFKVVRMELLSELIMLQKKAAELGNSLFWIVFNLEQQNVLGNIVIDLLNELLQNVVEDNRLVPYHMKALMYQNLGMVYYEEYQRLLTAGGDDDTAFPSPSSPIKSDKRQILYRAKDYLQQSVEIFDKQFLRQRHASSNGSSSNRIAESYENNTSIQLEIIHSKQILAGVQCMLHEYNAGKGLWKETITLLENFNQNLSVGILSERLSIVYYNAAICHFETHDRFTTLIYLERAIERLQFMIHEKTSSLMSQEHSPQVKDLKSLLQLITKFQEQVVQTSQKQGIPDWKEKDLWKEESRSQEIKPPATSPSMPKMKIVFTETGEKKYVPISEDHNNSGSQVKTDEVLDNGVQTSVTEDDDYEWEECKDFETEGCETFLVIEEDHAKQLDKLPTAASLNQNPIDATTASSAPTTDEYDELYEGMDEEERAELIEIRERFAKQSKMLQSGQQHIEHRNVVPQHQVFANNRQQEEKGEDQNDIEALQKRIKALEKENLALKSKLESIKTILSY